jgi:hypothetical protein
MQPRGVGVFENSGSRSTVLKLALLGGAAAAGLTSFAESDAFSATAVSEAQDRRIFQFALALEDLTSAFYGQALDHGGLSGELRHFAEVAGAHERAHAARLRRALGRHARPAPTFKFGKSTRDRASFIATATELEDLAVAAYNGQAANLTKKALPAALGIVSVEGRHAAWIRAIADEAPAPRAADPGEGTAEVEAILRRLHLR